MADLAKLLTAVTKGATVPSEHVDMMWSTLVTGIVVVFLILVLLVFILWALGKILNIKKKPKNTPAESVQAVSAQAEPTPAAAESVIEEYDGDDSEIIAVIAAAIAAYGEADGKQYRIASVKRKEKSLRSNWSAAGINENTRPF
ncbi:MAG: sodium pump decarboxylase subunit gamma [Ruminococcaceae bacterium]|nr:sodium pump decarboxylase subunit gamma [Oscillospiraceae bacterium]